ncbi:hypothetical protein HYW29_00075 [Candidatus Amesbacteria bacterium]|nr:hypothetical protein [Candidatus Amesbacteria bacterium]
MSTIKRYQVYLDSRSVGILDESAGLLPFTRSWVVREAVDAAAGRLGNLLAGFIKPDKAGYSELEKLIGSVRVKGKRQVNLSEKVDEIYYR